MPQKLYIVRGLPGSGKSTFAKDLLKRNPSMLHYEADMYFCRDGEYEFDSLLLHNAHKWCQESALEGLLAGRDVVVSNTFTQLWELQTYLDLAARFNAQVIVIELRTMWGSIHGVPAESIARMDKRWEAIPDDEVSLEFNDAEKLIQILK